VYFASKADELMTHMSSEFTEAANPNRTSASNFTTPNLFDRDTFNQRPQQGTERLHLHITLVFCEVSGASN
jgi:hypothetical protein